MIPWHIAVLIPARDEQKLLPRCLASVLAARALLPAHISSDLIVVTDRSTDDTYRLAEELIGGDGVVIESTAGCVGTARSLAAIMALKRYLGPLERCWFSNTDADCEVPETWLLDQLVRADLGAAAVAGIIAVDSFEEHDDFVPERFRVSYTVYPDGTHPHVHGANFGVRADAYLKSGGWGNLSTAEDHDLWQRLHIGQYARFADANLCVVTSGRRVGRAPHGFARALAAHNLEDRI